MVVGEEEKVLGALTPHHSAYRKDCQKDSAVNIGKRHKSFSRINPTNPTTLHGIEFHLFKGSQG
mgnify:CR=1 FL=1